VSFQMKKLVSVILLILFLFNSAGYYLVFKINQNKIRSQIKTEIKLSLNTNELKKITFSFFEIKSINWVKENKEFIYKNNMYDVVKSEKTDTGVTFYCIDDKQEKELFANLDEHINTHSATNNKKNKTHKNSLDSFFKLYYSIKKSEKIFLNEEAIFYFSKNRIYASNSLEIDSPPPQFFS